MWLISAEIAVAPASLSLYLRFPRERQMFFILLLYMPLGIILTVLRVCISLQALLYLLVIPNSFPLKRYVIMSRARGHLVYDSVVL